MTIPTPLRKIGLDPGFGGFKCAEVQGSDTQVAVLPAVVGIGTTTDTGALSLGLKTRRLAKPLEVSFSGIGYLVGPNVHRYARPVERLDFQRLADGPELRTLLYAVLWQVLGGGDHRVALMVGLPVEVVQDREQARSVLRKLRAWLVGDHTFTVGGQAVTLAVEQVKAIAQPVGTYFAWGMGTNGQWSQSTEALEQPVAVCDIGFNTLDLFAVEGGQVAARFTGGDTLGMHRVAETLAGYVRNHYDLTVSLHEADALMRTYLKQGQATIYHAQGETDLGPVVEQALDETFAGITGFIRRHWERGHQFRHLILTGGGAQALRSRLVEPYPQAIILPDAVTANAAGLARYALRPRVFGALR